MIGVGATATGVTAGYSITPPPRLQVSTAAPASGAGNSSMFIYCRGG